MRARYKPVSAVALTLALAGAGFGLPAVTAIASHSAYVEIVIWEDEEPGKGLTMVPGLAACESNGALAGAVASVKGLFGGGRTRPETSCLAERGRDYVWVSHIGSQDPSTTGELLRTGRLLSAVDRNGMLWQAAEYKYPEMQEKGRWSYTWVVPVGAMLQLPSGREHYNFVAVADPARFDARVLPSDGAGSLRVQLGPAPLLA